MDLDERKEKILKAIIQTYLETGEPVGSRTISKYSDLNLSSATIRNEMSDLEDLGYIIQPHTSAGRIPSDKGYRFYVNQIIEEKNNEVTEIKDMMIQRVDRVELVTGELLGQVRDQGPVAGDVEQQRKFPAARVRIEECVDPIRHIGPQLRRGQELFNGTIAEPGH